MRINYFSFRVVAITSLAVIGLAGCSGQNRLASALPVTAEAPAQSQAVLVWVGIGEGYRWDNGQWRRAREQDYEFSVVQRRFDDRWESIKSMHRRHPGYDGSAGLRDQVHYFEIRPDEPRGATVPISVTSSMGAGRGTTDTQFRRWNFEMQTGATGFAARFMPYDRLQFQQSYLYEEGNLREEIILSKSSAQEPFFKIVETAQVFAPGSFDSPPTMLD